MKSMRTITDEMARLLSEAPINGLSRRAWEVSTVLAEYDAARRAEDQPSVKAGPPATAPANYGGPRLSSDDYDGPSDADMARYSEQAARIRHAARREP